MPERYPTIVVLGLSPTGLYTVRELSRAGFSLLGVADLHACGVSSRYLTHPERSWLIHDDELLVKRLCLLAQEEDQRPILLPTSDRYIEFVADYYTDLTEHFFLQPSYSPDYVYDLLEKGRFYKLCAQHGLDAPGIWYPDTKAELLGLVDQLPYPCILKPKLIHLAATYLKGRKVLLANNRAEYERFIKALPEGLGGWVVQEVIPGPESNILLLAGYFNHDSEPVETFTARKLRQYPPGFGSASLVQSETNATILEMSCRFLKQIGYRGICGTEFKLDSRDGKLKVIEINPRPTLWFHLSHAAGKRVAETACRDLVGLPITPSSHQVDGIAWRYAFKDLYSQLFYIIKGSRFVFPAPVIPEDIGWSGQTWAVYDPDDQRPALMEPINYMRKFFLRI
jgi:predicted ATP-grasp superfamily ATP-dependent carboligase